MAEQFLAKRLNKDLIEFTYYAPAKDINSKEVFIPVRSERISLDQLLKAKQNIEAQIASIQSLPVIEEAPVEEVKEEVIQ